MKICGSYLVTLIPTACNGPMLRALTAPIMILLVRKVNEDLCDPIIFLPLYLVSVDTEITPRLPVASQW